MRGNERLKILQVGTSDIGGGAEADCRDLRDAFVGLGHDARMAVGEKKRADDRVYVIENFRDRSWHGAFTRLAGALGPLGGKRMAIVCSFLRFIADPGRWLRKMRGLEEFEFAGTESLITHAFGDAPDVAILFNLHGPFLPGGGYFDLRKLPEISARVPVVMRPGDLWPVTGHCAYPFDCGEWKNGCATCRHLDRYVPIRKDAARRNRRIKQRAYERSAIYLATYSTWLRDRMLDSIAAPAIVKSAVIPIGFDLGVFRPGDKSAARARLALPTDCRIVLFSSVYLRRNSLKDYASLCAATALLPEKINGQALRFVALGDIGPPDRAGRHSIRFVPPLRDFATIADYYRAADVYVHATLGETFGRTSAESLLCGTPVVATAVGAVPEVVKGLNTSGFDRGWPTFDIDAATGILTPPGDPAALAAGIMRILGDDRLHAKLSANAARDASARFDIAEVSKRFLAYLYEVIEDFRRAHGRPG